MSGSYVIETIWYSILTHAEDDLDEVGFRAFLCQHWNHSFRFKYNLDVSRIIYKFLHFTCVHAWFENIIADVRLRTGSCGWS